MLDVAKNLIENGAIFENMLVAISIRERILILLLSMDIS